MRKIIIFLLGVFIFAPIITQGQVPNSVSVNSELKTSSTLQLPNYLKVNDMKLFNGYVYFCGQAYNKIGFIGRVKESLLNTSTTNIEWNKIDKTTTLNKLELYKDRANTYTHIVAIGNNDNSKYKTYNNIFFHCYEGNNWGYEIYAQDNTKNKIKEYFSDLVVNKDYVVVGGFYYAYDTNNIRTTQKYVCIRNYDKNNISNSAPAVYRYNYTASNLEPVFNKLELKEIDEENIKIMATMQLKQNTYELVGIYNTSAPSMLNNITIGDNNSSYKHIEQSNIILNFHIGLKLSYVSNINFK